MERDLPIGWMRWQSDRVGGGTCSNCLKLKLELFMYWPIDHAVRINSRDVYLCSNCDELIGDAELFGFDAWYDVMSFKDYLDLSRHK